MSTTVNNDSTSVKLEFAQRIYNPIYGYGRVIEILDGAAKIRWEDNDVTFVLPESHIFPENSINVWSRLSKRQRENILEFIDSNPQHHVDLTAKGCLEMLLEWEGIHGYTERILSMVSSVYGISLK